MLEGHAGIGKTRVVQEFFARLSKEQPEPPYWPPRLEGDHSSVLAGRSAIVPAGMIDWKPRQVQPYAWIGISCGRDERTRQPERALIRAVEEATESHEPIVAPMGRRRRVVTAIWHLVVAWTVLGAVIAGLVHFGGDIGDRIGVVVGLAGAVASVVFERRTPRELREEEQSIRRARADTRINLSSWLRDASKASLERAEGLLRELRRRQVPAVIVVDNAHWADPDTVDLIDSLLQLPNAPVLVVATARSDPFEQQLAERTGIGRLVWDFRAKSEVLGLGDLSEDLLIQLVRNRAPKTSRSVASALARHAAGNPLVLGGLLEEDRISRRLIEGAYEIEDPENVISDLPSDYEGVLESYWKQLPFEVRQLLAVASLHGLTVQTETVRDAFQAIFAEDAGPLIEQARDPYYWLDNVGQDLDRFSDGALLQIVSANLDRVASPDQLSDARRNMLGSIKERRADPEMWDALTPDARRVLMKFCVAAAQEGFTTTDHEAARSAVELAELTDGPREAAEAASFAELGMRWGAADDELLGQARTVAAARHRECGHLERAEELLGDELREAEISLGPDAEATLQKRFKLRAQIAMIAMDRRRIREVIAACEQLFADDQRTHVCPRYLMLGIRNVYAQALKDSGRFDEALPIFKQLAEETRSVYGEKSREFFTLRNNFAECLTSARDYDGAVTEFRSLLADEQAFGAEDRSMFEHRSNLAAALAPAGLAGEAVKLFRSLLTESERILGPVHPHTLVFRGNLASCLAEAKRIDEAIRQFRRLLADSDEILGADHPSTLTCRYNLLMWEQSALSTDEAIERFQALIGDQERVLEPDHQDTFRSRYHFARLLAEADREAQAIVEMKSLHAAQARVLGLGHPDTAHTELMLVAALFSAGRDAEADALIDSYMESDLGDQSMATEIPSVSENENPSRRQPDEDGVLMADRSTIASGQLVGYEDTAGAEALSRLADRFPALFAGPTLKACLSSGLPFYGLHRLVKLTLQRDDSVDAVFALLGSEGVYWLNGFGTGIYLANDVESLTLTDSTVGDYIRFFLYFVGTLVLVESPTELEDAAEASADASGEPGELTLEEAREHVRPLEIRKDDDGPVWSVRATVVADGSLFSALFTVSADGEVTMRSDDDLGPLGRIGISPVSPLGLPEKP